MARAHQDRPAFHATCTRTVTGVLRTTMPDDWTPTVGQLAADAEYLDRELPLLLDTPAAILGVPASVFAHRAPPGASRAFSTARTRCSRPRSRRDSSPRNPSHPPSDRLLGRRTRESVSSGASPGVCLDAQRPPGVAGWADPVRFRQARSLTVHPYPRRELTS
ncbi:tRNA-dependent cyclodipeptide synthase [Streptomyces sp. NPDC019531]|uniref:tRNA-dependent cyclodipeptide synthase n=1 Tax=Streptomyces sp. NPDC019531 TaxID=3365062 RepID=UPI00384F3AC8